MKSPRGGGNGQPTRSKPVKPLDFSSPLPKLPSYQDKFSHPCFKCASLGIPAKPQLALLLSHPLSVSTTMPCCVVLLTTQSAQRAPTAVSNSRQRRSVRHRMNQVGQKEAKKKRAEKARKGGDEGGRKGVRIGYPPPPPPDTRLCRYVMSRMHFLPRSVLCSVCSALSAVLSCPVVSCPVC